jgi:hypothetical protein
MPGQCPWTKTFPITDADDTRLVGLTAGAPDLTAIARVQTLGLGPDWTQTQSCPDLDKTQADSHWPGGPSAETTSHRSLTPADTRWWQCDRCHSCGTWGATKNRPKRYGQPYYPVVPSSAPDPPDISYLPWPAIHSLTRTGGANGQPVEPPSPGNARTFAGKTAINATNLCTPVNGVEVNQSHWNAKTNQLPAGITCQLQANKVSATEEFGVSSYITPCEYLALVILKGTIASCGHECSCNDLTPSPSAPVHPREAHNNHAASHHHSNHESTMCRYIAAKSAIVASS